MNFKFICEGLSKKIIFSVLTIIQFTIVLVCIYVGIGSMDDINKSVNSVNKYFDEGEYYKVDDEMAMSQGFSSDESIVRKNNNILKDIKSYFDSNNNIEFLSVRSDVVLVRKDEAINEAIVTYTMMNFENTDYMRVQGFCVNKKFLEKMNYGFLDGSIDGFNIEKDKDYIPVILGYVYKDKYKVGDRIETLRVDDTGEFKKSEMKVIGILSEDNYVHEDGILVEKQSLKNAVLFPYDENITLMKDGNAKLELIKNIELKNYLKSGYVMLNNGKSADKVNKELLNFEVKYRLDDLNKSMQEHKDELINQLKPGIYMAIIIILFSIVSVVIVMINAVVKDKKEFGINIMMGATMADIRIRVLGQVFLLLAMSIVISSIILKSFAVFKFNIIDLALTVGVMICVLIVISTMLILTLNKYSVNDLIRRNE